MLIDHDVHTCPTTLDPPFEIRLEPPQTLTRLTSKTTVANPYSSSQNAKSKSTRPPDYFSPCHQPDAQEPHRHPVGFLFITITDTTVSTDSDPTCSTPPKTTAVLSNKQLTPLQNPPPSRPTLVISGCSPLAAHFPGSQRPRRDCSRPGRGQRDPPREPLGILPPREQRSAAGQPDVHRGAGRFRTSSPRR